MPKRDARVDAYIANAADFAKPVLQHLRQLVHTGCPHAEETIKWSHPAFMHQGMLCVMAAFNKHCTFGFWKHSLVVGRDSASRAKADEAMGSLGRITALTDLPTDKILLNHIKIAARLNEQGVKVPRAPNPRKKKRLVTPPFFVAALKRNRKALATFEGFSPSHKREYIEWLAEAKREETKLKRLETALAWLADGKPRNWKYVNC